MLAVKLQGLDNCGDLFPLPDEFPAELLPAAISHWLLQPPRCAFMTLRHILEVSHSGPKASFDDPFIDQELCRCLIGIPSNVAHVHHPSSYPFTQSECPMKRENRR